MAKVAEVKKKKVFDENESDSERLKRKMFSNKWKEKKPIQTLPD